MSFLTPLYIAGALAVTLPVLFHLIRRTPRGETRFSSLMFLSPSPPRITRRSRIEHWLLLALRAAAIVLLAMAFARPFLRQPVQASDTDASQARVAIVVDTSASMRRGDLWRQAVRAVDEAIAACRPQDQIGVFACDETLRPIAGFEDMAQTPAAQRRAVVAQRLGEMEPTWAATHLGQALVDAAAAVNDVRDATEETGLAARRIVLVSDLQSGSRLQVLGDSAWPQDVTLELRRLKVEEPTNAGLWRLADDEESAAAGDDDARKEAAARLRIRVSNAADSGAEQFQLQWTNAAGVVAGPTIEAYVPPGTSRVVRVPPPEDEANQARLILQGDDHAFDNTLYFVSEDRGELAVAYLGDDAAGDPQGMRYYVESAAASHAGRDVRVDDFAALADGLDEQASETPLVIATRTPSADEMTVLQRYLKNGGTVLFALAEADGAAALAALLQLDELPAAEAEVDGYTMLRDIDFTHPLFAAMSGPKFNDFTQIRFWRYRRIELPAESTAVRVVARFETGDPAVIERRFGAGRLVALTVGWSPADGQLARSWKFLLMLLALVDDNRAAADFRTDYVVNERVPLPPRDALAERIVVTRPDGDEHRLEEGAAAYNHADEPGVYALAGADGPIRFAVNIDPLESDTAPLAAESFEQLGCRLVGGEVSQLDDHHQQQLRDVELESRQRIWQWLIVAVLALLVVESWLAGRLSRPAAAPALG